MTSPPPIPVPPRSAANTSTIARPAPAAAQNSGAGRSPARVTANTAVAAGRIPITTTACTAVPVSRASDVRTGKPMTTPAEQIATERHCSRLGRGRRVSRT